jgi:Domain of unknown function (DUF4402)
MNGANLIRWKKRSLLAGALTVGISAFSVPVQAKQATAETVVVTRLSFVKVDDLDMGYIIPSNQNGDVILSPTGTRTATNGITLVGAQHTTAKFAGYGRTGQAVSVSLGANQIFLTGPGPQMRLRNFTIGSTPTATLGTNPRIFTIASSTGAFQFPVGAELRVRANQPVGVYTGNWTITLNYQ